MSVSNPSNPSNTIDAFSAFSTSVDPQAQFSAARKIEQSVIQQRDISSQVATKAAQDVAQETATQQNQQMHEQNAAKEQAAAYAAKIGPDQLMGHLAQVQAESIEQALQQRKQYDKLNAISFFDNPINYLMAQPQKDQIAEQVNSAESAAEFAQNSISQINTLKSQHMKTAMETADVLSADAMMKQEHINMLTAQQKIAEAGAKLGTERLASIGLLQRGAVEQIQINEQKAAAIRAQHTEARAAASALREEGRYQIDQEKWKQEQLDKPMKDKEREARLAIAEAQMKHLQFEETMEPGKQELERLRIANETNKYEGTTAQRQLNVEKTQLQIDKLNHDKSMWAAEDADAKARFGNNTEKYNEWAAKTKLERDKVEASLKNNAVSLDLLNLTKSKEEAAKLAMETEDAALDLGTSLIGHPSSASPKYSKDTYNKDQMLIIKQIGYNTMQLRAQAIAKGLPGDQIWYGDNAGEALRNLDVVKASLTGKPQAKVYEWLQSLARTEATKLQKTGGSTGMNATQKQEVILGNVSSVAKETMATLNKDAENKNVRNLFADTSISAVFESNPGLANNELAKSVFQPMITSDVEGQKIDHAAIMGRLTAMLAEKKIGFRDAMAIGSSFFNTVAAHNNVFMNYSGFTGAYQEGYNVMVGDQSLDISDTANFTSVFLKYQNQNRINNLSNQGFMGMWN